MKNTPKYTNKNRNRNRNRNRNKGQKTLKQGRKNPKTEKQTLTTAEGQNQRHQNTRGNRKPIAKTKKDKCQTRPSSYPEIPRCSFRAGPDQTRDYPKGGRAFTGAAAVFLSSALSGACLRCSCRGEGRGTPRRRCLRR